MDYTRAISCPAWWQQKHFERHHSFERLLARSQCHTCWYTGVKDDFQIGWCRTGFRPKDLWAAWRHGLEYRLEFVSHHHHYRRQFYYHAFFFSSQALDANMEAVQENYRGSVSTRPSKIDQVSSSTLKDWTSNSQRDAQWKIERHQQVLPKTVPLTAGFPFQTNWQAFSIAKQTDKTTGKIYIKGG